MGFHKVLKADRGTEDEGVKEKLGIPIEGFNRVPADRGTEDGIRSKESHMECMATDRSINLNKGIKGKEEVKKEIES